MDSIIPPDDTPLKRCPTCPEDNQWHPATAKYFYRDKSKRDGFENNCKSCRYTPHPKALKSPIPAEKRICTKCGKEKHLLRFSKNASNVDGYRTQCKDCDEEYNNAYKQTHREQINVANLKRYHRNRDHINQRRRERYIPGSGREQSRQWHRENKERAATNKRSYRLTHPNSRREARLHNIERYREKGRETSHRYRLRHLELVQERINQWNERNPQKRCEYAKRYRQENPEHVRALGRLHENKRRAIKLAIGGSFTLQDIERQYRAQKGKCYWCHKKLKRYEIDHITPVTREGSSNNPWNLVLSCKPCNASRGNKLPHEWPRGGRLL